MVLCHGSDHRDKILHTGPYWGRTSSDPSTLAAGVRGGRAVAEGGPVCRGSLLKLGHPLHETPFSNRNHEKNGGSVWFVLKTR